MKILLTITLILIPFLSFAQNLTLEQFLMLHSMDSNKTINYLKKKAWKISSLTNEKGNIFIVLNHKPETNYEYLANKTVSVSKNQYIRRNEESRIQLFSSSQNVVKSISLEIFNPQIFKKFKSGLKNNKYSIFDHFFLGDKMVQLYKRNSTIIRVLTTKSKNSSFQKINLWKVTVMSEDYYSSYFIE